MKIVVDANVILSAAIVNGKTREIIQLADATFLAPPELEDEVRSYTSLIREKTSLSASDTEELLDLLFAAVGTVPYDIPIDAMRKSRDTIGNRDPDDVPYLATAIAVNATAIWSDDGVYEYQNHVDWYTTQEIISKYDHHQLD